MGLIKVLVIAAHHDDETLGCGATMARLYREGHEVHVFVLGQGPAARVGTDPLIAVSDCMRATSHLGAQLYLKSGEILGNLPDNQFDTIPTLTVARNIGRVIEDLQPDMVFTHHFGDINQDHRKVHEASLIATRTYASPVKCVYMYEVSGATDCGFRREHAFVPDWYQAITPTELQRKIQGMEMYETERRLSPHPRSQEVLQALATWRGAQAGVPLAEAFELVRCVR